MKKIGADEKKYFWVVREISKRKNNYAPELVFIYPESRPCKLP